jgi:hypothetical protein
MNEFTVIGFHADTMQRFAKTVKSNNADEAEKWRV